MYHHTKNSLKLFSMKMDICNDIQINYLMLFLFLVTKKKWFLYFFQIYTQMQSSNCSHPLQERGPILMLVLACAAMRKCTGHASAAIALIHCKSVGRSSCSYLLALRCANAPGMPVQQLLSSIARAWADPFATYNLPLLSQTSHQC
jgi:hypothetical protein